MECIDLLDSDDEGDIVSASLDQLSMPLASAARTGSDKLGANGAGGDGDDAIDLTDAIDTPMGMNFFNPFAASAASLNVDDDGAIVIDDSPVVARRAFAQMPPPETLMLLDSDSDSDDDLNRKPAASQPGLWRERRLQAARDRDRELAMRLARQDDEEQRTSSQLQELSLKVAAKMQEKEEKFAKRARAREMALMSETTTGRAFRFVEKVIAKHAELKTQLSNSPVMQSQDINSIEPVSKDDMVFLAERLIDIQATFRKDGKPWVVDLGYHYTNEPCMERIKTDGLLNKNERDREGIKVQFNGAALGHGIYTANDSISSQGYGTVGLLVARLIGVRCDRSTPKGADSIVTPGVIVLVNSAQCIPLIRFSQQAANAPMAAFQAGIQTIIDECLNTEPKESLPVLDDASDLPVRKRRKRVNVSSLFDMDDDPIPICKPAQPVAAPPPPPKPQVSYRAPKKKDLAHVANGTYQFNAPLRHKKKASLSQLYKVIPKSQASTGEECPLCLDAFSTEKSVCLNACGHSFHLSCLEETFVKFKECPTCRKALDPPQGTSPSGNMTVGGSSKKCQGFTCRSISITYKIPAGKQLQYHPKPGHSYKAATSRAFLPDNQDGNKLLRRLVHAFQNGMTFEVGGDSKNQVIYSSIPHKQNCKNGGEKGFPDKDYFADANAALDSLGVPRP